MDKCICGVLKKKTFKLCFKCNQTNNLKKFNPFYDDSDELKVISNKQKYNDELTITLKGDYYTLPDINGVCKNCCNSKGRYVKYCNNSSMGPINYYDYNTYDVRNDKLFCGVCYTDIQNLLIKDKNINEPSITISHLNDIATQKQKLFKNIVLYPYLFKKLYESDDIEYEKKLYIASDNTNKITLRNDEIKTHTNIKMVLNRKIINSSVIKNFIMGFIYNNTYNF